MYCIRTPDRIQAITFGATHSETEEMGCQPFQAFLHLSTQTANLFTYVISCYIQYFTLINKYNLNLNKSLKTIGKVDVINVLSTAMVALVSTTLVM